MTHDELFGQVADALQIIQRAHAQMKDLGYPMPEVPALIEELRQLFLYPQWTGQTPKEEDN